MRQATCWRRICRCFRSAADNLQSDSAWISCYQQWDKNRKFHAFDATSGALRWEFPTNSGITGQPSTFMVDGKQYVAVQSGWGVDARGMELLLNGLFPGKYPEVPEGGAIWVFAVK